MKFKVRDDYVVKLGREVFRGGDVVELDDEQAANFANIIEPAEAPKKAAKKAPEAAAE